MKFLDKLKDAFAERSAKGVAASLTVLLVWTRYSRPNGKGNTMKNIIATLALMASFSVSASGWGYKTFTDEKTLTVTEHAAIGSVNSLNLSAPYGGENRGRLGIMISLGMPASYPIVVFLVQKGQINCPAISGCRVVVRIDDADPMLIGARASPDNSSAVALYPKEMLRFIEGVTKAKRILVQVDMLQNGLQVLEFQNTKPPVEPKAK